eukprot:TRINITY_DN15448_c0_g1_i1.p1 TRINITY_DN15448_c0_g1~~TRINITY_DN15448_c0_g1_i1.p1  ORF type:complete len:903 (-),score=273.71 TRINITY_DN15448_c0_g1_i1:133-2841(-)
MPPGGGAGASSAARAKSSAQVASRARNEAARSSTRSPSPAGNAARTSNSTRSPSPASNAAGRTSNSARSPSPAASSSMRRTSNGARSPSPAPGSSMRRTSNGARSPSPAAGSSMRRTSNGSPAPAKNRAPTPAPDDDGLSDSDDSLDFLQNVPRVDNTPRPLLFGRVDTETFKSSRRTRNEVERANLKVINEKFKMMNEVRMTRGELEALRVVLCKEREHKYKVQEKIRKAKQDKVDLQERIDAEEAEKGHLEIVLEELGDEIVSLEGQVEDLQHEGESAGHMLTMASRARSILQQQLSSCAREEKEYKSKITKLKRMKQSLHKDGDFVEKDTNFITQDLRKTELQVAKLEHDLDVLKENVGEKKMKYFDMERKSRSLADEVLVAENDCKQLQDEIQEAVAQMTRFEKKQQRVTKFRQKQDASAVHIGKDKKLLASRLGAAGELHHRIDDHFEAIGTWSPREDGGADTRRQKYDVAGKTTAAEKKSSLREYEDTLRPASEAHNEEALEATNRPVAELARSGSMTKTEPRSGNKKKLSDKDAAKEKELDKGREESKESARKKSSGSSASEAKSQKQEAKTPEPPAPSPKKLSKDREEEEEGGTAPTSPGHLTPASTCAEEGIDEDAYRDDSGEWECEPMDSEVGSIDPLQFDLNHLGCPFPDQDKIGHIYNDSEDVVWKCEAMDEARGSMNPDEYDLSHLGLEFEPPEGCIGHAYEDERGDEWACEAMDSEYGGYKAEQFDMSHLGVVSEKADKIGHIYVDAYDAVWECEAMDSTAGSVNPDKFDLSHLGVGKPGENKVGHTYIDDDGEEWECEALDSKVGSVEGDKFYMSHLGVVHEDQDKTGHVYIDSYDAEWRCEVLDSERGSENPDQYDLSHLGVGGGAAEEVVDKVANEEADLSKLGY